MLKNLICKSSLKQDYIAHSLNTSQQTISSWCCGRTEPNITQLNKLHKILNCSLEELVLAIIETRSKKNEG